MKSYLMAAAALALILAAAPEAFAKPGKGNGSASASQDDISIEIVISDRDRRAIYDFGRQYPSYGGEALPPGMYKRLAQGKPLPPGIAKKYFPADFRRGLGLPVGQDVIIIGRDAVIISVSTQTILEILRSVF